MIKRIDHKEKAKSRLKVSRSGMIGANVLSGFLDGASTTVVNSVTSAFNFTVVTTALGGVGAVVGIATTLLNGGDIEDALGAIIGSVGGLAILPLLLLAIINVFMTNAVSGIAIVGNRRYYLYTVKHGLNPGIAITLDGFNDFWNVMLTFGLRALIILLYQAPGWLLVILGIFLCAGGTTVGAGMFVIAIGALEIFIAGWFGNLQLWCVEWIKSDRPELTPSQVIAESKKCTKSHIGDLLVFELSWIPWNLLNRVTSGLVGLFYSTPYRREASALVYQELKGEGVSMNSIEESGHVMTGGSLGHDTTTDAVEVGIVIGTRGCFAGQSVELVPGLPVVVGRADNANVRIAGAGSESVSGQHCTIRFVREKNVFEVTDTSSNGTFVNGKRLQKGLVSIVPCGAELTLADDRNKLKLDKTVKR
ncbi:MAG: DUF975 family protein [Lachnospiraceae bacterium]|nr:DUF975 family protein [Lachnospiraceae bacterium]